MSLPTSRATERPPMPESKTRSRAVISELAPLGGHRAIGEEPRPGRPSLERGDDAAERAHFLLGEPGPLQQVAERIDHVRALLRPAKAAGRTENAFALT